MSVPANEAKSTPEGVKPISKVTFSPLNSEALLVSIKTVAPKPGEVMEPQRRSGSLDSRRRSKLLRSLSEKNLEKSTMTDYRREISVASQTSAEQPHLPSSKTDYNISPHTPCLKHAAENISLKANDMSTDKLSLCNNCSKSMLSYIFVVQDFLDSLTKEICGRPDSCAQCMREEFRQQMIARSDEAAIAQSRPEKRVSSSRRKAKESERYENSKASKDSRLDKIVRSSGSDVNNTGPLGENRQAQNLISYPTNSSSFVNLGEQSTSHPLSSTPSSSQPTENVYHVQDEQNVQHLHQVEQNVHYRQSEQADHPSKVQEITDSSRTATLDQEQNVHYHQSEQKRNDHHSKIQQSTDPSRTVTSHQEQYVPPSSHSNQSSTQSIQHPKGLFIKTMERQQPDFNKNISHNERYGDSDDVFRNPDSATSPLGEASEGHISSLTNAEREVYDSARNGAGFENLAETHERLVAPDGRILTEAYVTMCRNNAEALGCLVVGTSLLLTQTKRTLCVLVSDGVSMAFREPLSAIFHVVQTVRQLDSLGTTKLALLEQPELGISFEKLNVWRLKQFYKCVYLNPDTLVVQNCDELFDREELSAVPDVGWPDCFNSGVFVYQPSDHTFWQLLEFSDKQGNGEGGDQGLLNSYFSSWNNDINKKLSFIYNLMANVSYTYTPAFKQFGKDVKIVQFLGTSKPWHVKFFSVTGLISPVSNVHPNYADFVNKWIKIFLGNALRQLSQKIQEYARSQELLSAVELLRFFPLPTESESEFFLTPVSVRLPLTEMKLQRMPRPIEDAKRRKSAEFPRHSKADIEEETKIEDSKQAKSIVSHRSEEESSTTTVAEGETEDLAKNKSKDTPEEQGADENEGNKLPGAEVGDYQGMKKWEQGKMDYQGKDSSDSVVKRLNFLMSQPKQ